MTSELDKFEYRVLKRIYLDFAAIFLIYYLCELVASFVDRSNTIVIAYWTIGTIVNIGALAALGALRQSRKEHSWLLPVGIMFLILNVAIRQLSIFFLPYDAVLSATSTLIYPMAVIVLGFYTQRIWIPVIFSLLLVASFICIHMIFPAFFFAANPVPDPYRATLVFASFKILVISLLLAILLSSLHQLLYQSRQRKQDYFKRLSYYDQETGLPNIRELSVVTAAKIAKADAENSVLVLAGLRLTKLEEMSEKLGYENMINWILRFSGELTASLDLWLRGLSGLPEDEPTQLFRLESSLLIFPILIPRQLYQAGMGLPEALAKNVLDVLKAEHVDSLVDFFGAITTYPDDGGSSAELLNNILNILHRSTADQKMTFIPFNSSSFDQYLRKERLKEQMLSESFATEVYAVFQPKVVITDETCTEFEALARWKNPILGLISPGEFIPLAEHVNTMRILTKKIFMDTKHFIERCNNAGIANVKVAVNLSPSLISRDYLTTLSAWIVNNNLGNSLELEITEGVLLNTTHETEEIFALIKATGVAFAIDDFGTGYSNLSYLQRFNAEVIKIDKCFIDELPSNTKNANLIQAILLMAKAFGMTTVAEGVENADQLAFLRDAGCNLIQGYYFSKPLEAQEALQFISTHQP